MGLREKAKKLNGDWMTFGETPRRITENLPEKAVLKENTPMEKNLAWGTDGLSLSKDWF